MDLTKVVLADQERSARDPELFSTSSRYRKEQEKKLKLYVGWNVIRFAVIAALVCSHNIQNQSAIERDQKDCCDCYIAARNPLSYGLKENQQIDWSYCMPDCVDCQFCDRKMLAASPAPSPSKLPISKTTTFECPVENSHERKPIISLHWKKTLGCKNASNISITTMEIFLKNYKNYGIGMLVLVVLYILANITLVNCGKRYCNLDPGALLFVWNVPVCIVAVYTMFKPMQYYRKGLQHVDGGDQFHCQVDSINRTMETLITVCVFVAFKIIGFDITSGLLRIWISRKATNSRNQSDFGRRLHNFHRKLIRFQRVELVITMIFAIFFLGVMITASVMMIGERLKEHHAGEDVDVRNIIVLVVVDVLAVLSVIDIHCFEFCRNTRSYYFRRTTTGYGKGENFRSLFGSNGSINEQNNRGRKHQHPPVTLQTSDVKSNDPFWK